MPLVTHVRHFENVIVIGHGSFLVPLALPLLFQPDSSKDIPRAELPLVTIHIHKTDVLVQTSWFVCEDVPGKGCVSGIHW
jgi:hypothetical protein